MSKADNPEWEDIEHALISFRSISSMLCIVLEGQERKTDQYSAIEGVIQLADFQERKLSNLVCQTH
ncbi:hypothetical protein AB9R81_15650 [Vibrio cyclitrophicus]|uniref:Uncharacterized protein n=1 Tax=Vibrio coralliirubri TaxID=1516159 RepID=A0AA87BYI2_9VIBR|nr:MULTISPECIES: hypothetical protein [Vibrio]MCC4862172.1 hypothetical protein [Vibrio splendidus]CAK2254051.1 conserved hypothetical protein [Vibrio crassostreae]CDT72418.1 hypothetical protein VCR31J2_1290181 [Vibrio coralliirubri]